MVLTHIPLGAHAFNLPKTHADNSPSGAVAPTEAERVSRGADKDSLGVAKADFPVVRDRT